MYNMYLMYKHTAFDELNNQIRAEYLLALKQSVIKFYILSV